MPNRPEKDTADPQDDRENIRLKVREIHPLLRIVLIFLLIILSVVILYYGKPLLLPLAVAAILAMMLNPLMNRMIKNGVPQWLAVISLSLTLVILGGTVVFLFGRQIGMISKDWPEIHQKLSGLLYDTEHFIWKTFNVKPADQESSAAKALPFKDLIMSVLGSMRQVITDSFLVLIYVILMLLVRKHFKELIFSLSGRANRTASARAMNECVKVCSEFLVGRLIIVAIVIIIYCAGFWLGDVPFPFFLALIAGILSLIPFLGNIIGGIIACVLAFVMGSMISTLVVLGVIAIGQLVGDYILTPWILGDAVRLNPFVTIVSVVAFTILWGPVGAIFALPIVAMLRVLFQNIEGAGPYAAFLIGKK